MNQKPRNIAQLSMVLVYLFDCGEIVCPAFSRIFKVLKYGGFAVAFAGCGICLLYRVLERRKLKYSAEIKMFFVVFLYFVIVSLCKIFQEEKFTYKTIEELVQLALPFIFAFIILNYLSLGQIMNAMRICLAVSFISYLITKRNELLVLGNWFNMSFGSSYSAFESSDFAEMASGLSAFFIYYRKKCPVAAVISAVFVIMTFKRILILQLIMLILISLFSLSDKRVSNMIINASIVIVTAVTYCYQYLLQRENAAVFTNLFKADIGSFTMGRVYRLWYPLSGYVSYGFGSTTAELGNCLEMDLIKIVMEVGLIGLVLFIWCYFKVAGNKFYSYAVMGAMFVNLLFASGLTSTVGWISRITALAAISCYGSGSAECAGKRRRRRLVYNARRIL